MSGDAALRLAVAGAIAREAGAVARRAFRDRRSDAAITLKGPQDYLSETDAEVERLIRTRLTATFPGEAFFGEEEGGAFGEAGWVVDPIDGTANFVRGIATFCVSIAFVRGGRIEVGTIYDPIRDELFAASAGNGARLDGEPIAVAATPDLGVATVEAGWSNRRPAADYVALLGRIAATGAGIRRAGSGALGLANVAAGRIDAYCELHINSWDCLAGILLVREAGGWTNDFLAGDGLTTGNPVLACPPRLRHALCEATGIR